MSHARRPQSSASDDAAIEKAAADWITRLDRGLSPEEAVQFAAWETADPRHGAELTHMNSAWRLLDTADEVPAIMRLAQEVETRQERRAVVRRWRRMALTAVGAAAAVALALTIFPSTSKPAKATPEVAVSMSSSRPYQVVASAAQRLTLADGSLVELRADSQVETAFSAGERRVSIVRGEAYFTVTKDASRPFIVHAGDVAVRAVGTAFNVRLAPATVEVLVTEGQVRVQETATNTSLLSAKSSSTEPFAAFPVLGAGQRVVISATAPAVVPPLAASADEVERALAWRSTQLVFERTSLEDVIAAFNSFNRHQLSLGDAALRTRRLGGRFRADNIDAFVRLLETGFEITAERPTEFEIVLRSAAAGPKRE
jgi:transmembrane sensor